MAWATRATSSGSVMLSGRRIVLKSRIASSRSVQPNTTPGSSAAEGKTSNAQTARPNAHNSEQRTAQPILAPQYRQVPACTIQLQIGINSCQRSCFAQLSQRERSKITARPCGRTSPIAEIKLPTQGADTAVNTGRTPSKSISECHRSCCFLDNDGYPGGVQKHYTKPFVITNDSRILGGT